jgi:hypothetical protein
VILLHVLDAKLSLRAVLAGFHPRQSDDHFMPRLSVMSEDTRHGSEVLTCNRKRRVVCSRFGWATNSELTLRVGRCVSGQSLRRLRAGPRTRRPRLERHRASPDRACGLLCRSRPLRIHENQSRGWRGGPDQFVHIPSDAEIAVARDNEQGITRGTAQKRQRDRDCAPPCAQHTHKADRHHFQKGANNDVANLLK